MVLGDADEQEREPAEDDVGAELLDFNIASRVGDPVHTQSGTPPYQPPNAGLIRWDVSTDLFAVGVLLYRPLCNGHNPFPHAMPVADVPVTDPATIRPTQPRPRRVSRQGVRPGHRRSLRHGGRHAARLARHPGRPLTGRPPCALGAEAARRRAG